MSSLATLILLFLSDALVVRRSSGGSRAGRRKAGSNLGATSSDGYAPAPVSRLRRAARCGYGLKRDMPAGCPAGGHFWGTLTSPLPLLLQAAAV